MLLFWVLCCQGARPSTRESLVKLCGLPSLKPFALCAMAAKMLMPLVEGLLLDSLLLAEYAAALTVGKVYWMETGVVNWLVRTTTKCGPHQRCGFYLFLIEYARLRSHTLLLVYCANARL